MRCATPGGSSARRIIPAATVLLLVSSIRMKLPSPGYRRSGRRIRAARPKAIRGQCRFARDSPARVRAPASTHSTGGDPVDARARLTRMAQQVLAPGVERRVASQHSVASTLRAASDGATSPTSMSPRCRSRRRHPVIAADPRARRRRPRSDLAHASCRPRGQHGDAIADRDRTGFNATHIPARKLHGRPRDELDGEAQWRVGRCLRDFDGFEDLQQRRAIVPIEIAAAVDDHVAGQRRQRDKAHVADAGALGKFEKIVDDARVDILAVVDEIHLVDRDDEERMPTRCASVACRRVCVTTPWRASTRRIASCAVDAAVTMLRVYCS